MGEEQAIRLFNGDNMKVLAEFEDNSIGSIVSDIPYGLKFMGKKWDYDVPSVETWKECLRVLKPGGHMAIFCGTRTQHRAVINIEDAGFEIRDVITWLYGQGFPKSFNISNGIEGILVNGSSNTKDFKKLDGVETEKGLGYVTTNFEQGNRPNDYNTYGTYKTEINYTTEEAREWIGWGTALKPACEFITICRKPISEKNIALNVLKWGVGGINIDDCRIELNGEIVPINKLESWSGFGELEKPDYIPTENTKGRFPANVILDDEAGEMLNEQTGQKANRFFYCAKASGKEKDFGLDEFETVDSGTGALRDGGRGKRSKNSHPTVKPIELMKYVVKLVTPLGEICLDPFMGSGSTVIASKLLGIKAIGIEQDTDYFSLAEARVDAW
jgi:site-specific DNA-methyltransferase (adenine-specific)